MYVYLQEFNILGHCIHKCVYVYIPIYISVIHVRESYFHVYFIRNKNNQSIIYMVIMLIGVASAESKKTEPEWKQKADEKRQRIISKQ